MPAQSKVWNSADIVARAEETANMSGVDLRLYLETVTLLLSERGERSGTASLKGKSLKQIASAFDAVLENEKISWNEID